MSNYVKSVNFAAKDALTTGDPLKIAKGTEINTEYDNIATAVATKEDSANKGAANGYCDLDASALVPDSRLSSAVARLASANVFTNNQTISSTQPNLYFRETDGGSNQQFWRFVASAAQFIIQTQDDAQSGSGNIVAISRSGTTVTAIALTSTALTWNGNTLFSTANDGSGSGLDADTVDGSHASSFASSSHTHAASDVNSGTLADGRIAQSNVTQHQAALSIACSQLTSTLADARLVSTNVTQFNSSITGRNVSSKAGIAKTLSSSGPSGGSDGDIWYQY